MSCPKKQRSHQPSIKSVFCKKAHLNDIPNNDEEVVTNVNVSTSSNKTKRKWRNQWTLLHPWAYLTKSLLGDEKIKCMWCEEARRNNVFTDGGSLSMQLSSLNEHSKSSDHVIASAMYHVKIQKENANVKGPMDDKISEIMHLENERIILCMKLVHFYACNDIPLEKYVKQCQLQRELGTPMDEIRGSPFFSILIDESTDRTLEKHLIIYVLYLSEGGKGEPQCKFVRLLPVENGKAEGIYNTINEFILESNLDLKKLVAFASDGASSMVGKNNGAISKFQSMMPNILGVHCIAHREALAIKDAYIMSHAHVFSFLDVFANKVYSWLGKSTNRHKELKEIMKRHGKGDLKVLKIHSIRWLSRGQVMERLVTLMPAILEQWEKHEKKWYEYATIFQVQFMLHLLADILLELNKLNEQFQRELMDVTMLGVHLDIIHEKLRRRYLSCETFGTGSMFLANFLDNVKDGILTYIGCDNVTHSHPLKFIPIPNSKEVTKRSRRLVSGLDSENEDSDFNLNMFHGNVENGSLDECITIGKDFVQHVIDALNNRFPDVTFFNAVKLFNPSSYPIEENEREKKTTEWLHKLIGKFNIDRQIVDMKRCFNEREDFVGMLVRIAKGRGMHDAWDICCKAQSWWQLFPGIMQLWQLCMTIPISTTACERGFSRQNIIKNDIRNGLSLETLDALMFISLNAQETSNICWRDIFNLWYEEKERRILSLK